MTWIKREPKKKIGAKERAKRIVYRTIVFIIVVIAATLGGQFGRDIWHKVYPAPDVKQKKAVEEAIIKGATAAVKTINENAPIMVDDLTRLEKATVGPGARLVYHQTLITLDSTKVDKKKFFSGMKEKIEKSICEQGKIIDTIERGGIFSYRYSGKNGGHIATINIDQINCLPQEIKN